MINTIAIDRRAFASRGSDASSQKNGAENENSASRGDAVETVEKDWTIMAYMNGDNNLEATELNSLLQMERVGSSERVNILAQIDRRALPEEAKDESLGVDGDWGGARRYYIEKGAGDPSKVEYIEENGIMTDARIVFKTDKIASKLVEDMGETNMADPDNLANFIQWGIKNFPAKHYMLLLQNHGMGYLGHQTDDDPVDLMSTPALAKALRKAESETGKKLDIVGFDACLMGSVEVAYEIRNNARIMVASEDSEIVPGWQTANILERIVAGCGGETLTPEKVASIIVEESAKAPIATPTMSAIDLSKIGKVHDCASALAEDLIPPDVSKYYVRKSINQAQHFHAGDLPMGNYADLGDLAKNLAANPKISNERIRKHAEELLDAVSKSLIAEQHKGEEVENATGMLIYAPTNVRAYDPFAIRHPLTNEVTHGEYSYDSLAFAKNNKWRDLIKSSFNFGS